jgi:hypothetical protein
VKKFVWGIGVAVMLAAPAVASATHVSGATYNGTVSTGSGGTVELIVSDDGQTLSFEAEGLGNGSTCTDVGFGPIPDIPISNHSFSYLSDNGLISASGTFGVPGDASGGAQVLTTPCTTGSQAWTAATLVAGPDATIARSSDASARGEDVYNASAAGQVRKWSAKRGQTRHFDVGITNDGNLTGSFAVKGCGSSKGFRVRYEDSGDNLTSAVVAGYTTAPLSTGESLELDLAIKVQKKAKVGKTKSCKIVAEADGGIDAVKAELKVKRG